MSRSAIRTQRRNAEQFRTLAIKRHRIERQLDDSEVSGEEALQLTTITRQMTALRERGVLR